MTYVKGGRTVDKTDLTVVDDNSCYLTRLRTSLCHVQKCVSDPLPRFSHAARGSHRRARQSCGVEAPQTESERYCRPEMTVTEGQPTYALAMKEIGSLRLSRSRSPQKQSDGEFASAKSTSERVTALAKLRAVAARNRQY